LHHWARKLKGKKDKQIRPDHVHEDHVTTYVVF